MKKRKGFTLIELLLTVALVGIIFMIGANLLILQKNTHSKSMGEFNLQSITRLSSQKINDVVRDSSAVFLLNKDYPPEDKLEEHLTEGWNYIMLDENKTKLVEWVWDDSEKIHKKKVITELQDEASYKLSFDKGDRTRDEKLIKFNLDILLAGKEMKVTSELESINSLQAIDRSYGLVANTLAYRSDPRLTDIGVAQAALSFIIDKSGSMTSKDGGTKTRLEILKEEATKMIEGLSEYDNVYLSISPFSTTANSSAGDNLNKMLPLKTNKSTFINTSNSVIQKLVADGGTNTGDGMRRGLGTISEFNSRIENADKTTKNFMIILVDGDTTYGTATENIVKTISVSSSSNNASVKVDRVLYPGTSRQRTYKYTRTTSSGIIFKTYTHYFEYPGDSYIDYLEELDRNVDDYTTTNSSGNLLSSRPLYNIGENNYKPGGKVIGNGNNDTGYYGRNYVTLIGNMIQEYKNTREDGIKVFVIGFGVDTTSDGLQQIANAVKSTSGTHGNPGQSKYYKADTAAALEAVLNEIKFQISEALWHIGGPN